MDALPTTTDGVIQLREKEGRDRKGENIARPLPVYLATTWERADTVPNEGITFSYPAFGEVAQVKVSDLSALATSPDWDFRTEISISAADSSNLYGLFVGENRAQFGSLIEWFSRRVDRTSALLGAGVYEQRTLRNGVSVLVRAGEAPAGLADAPLPDVYAMSPSRKQIFLVQTGDDSKIDVHGISRSQAIPSYLALFESMTFDR